MKMTGEVLKEHREKQGLSVAEVAAAIKVNTKTVVAIEEGDTDSLPAKTFLRGFVRSYAKLLNLDVESILANFYEEMGSTKPKLAIRDQDNEEKRKKALEQSMDQDSSPLSKKIAWGGVGFVVIVLIVFILQQVEKYEQESVTPPLSSDIKAIQKETNLAGQPDDSSDSQNTAGLESLESSKTDETESGKKKDSEKKTAKKSAKKPEKKEIKATVEKKKEEKKETPKEEKIAKEKPKENKKKEKTPPKELPKKVAKKEKSEEKKKKIRRSTTPQELIIEAFDRITITYRVNDGEKKTLRLSGDDIRVIKEKGAIELSISDGGSVNVVHNGKDLGVPGSLGSPIDLSFQ